MSSSTDNPPSGVKVELFKLKNRLKDKLGMQHSGRDDGPGHIDPEAIAEADRMIEKLCEECPATIAAHLEDMQGLWNEMKDMPRSTERDELSQKIFTISHEIKDLGSMCGYTLAAYFAESLRDFIGQTEMKLEAQRVIIQAHVDALHVVIKQDMKDADDSAANELKTMVKIAVDKYS